MALRTQPARERPFLRLHLSVLIGLSACDSGPDMDEARDLDAAVPDVPACDVAREWSRDWVKMEDEVRARIDEARARGADCGDAGKLPVAPRLSTSGALVCAARAHALSMAARGFTGHVDPDGVDETTRAAAAGYEGTIVEHWAAGPDDARALVDALWLRSPLHCADLVTRDFVDVGIGHVGDVEAEHDRYWVVVLGAP